MVRSGSSFTPAPRGAKNRNLPRQDELGAAKINENLFFCKLKFPDKANQSKPGFLYFVMLMDLIFNIGQLTVFCNMLILINSSAGQILK
jgi:hypothetical protein